MKIEYDKEVDAAYIYLKYPIKDGEVKKTVSIKENVNLDFDAEDRLIGIELLDASKMLNKKALLEAQTV